MTHKGPSALVVGGCGFLGRHLVSQIIETGLSDQVAVIDLQIASKKIRNVSYFSCDISDAGQVRLCLEKIRPDLIFHTASPSPLSDDLPLYTRVNVDGTRNLLEVAHSLKVVKAFVYTSSASVVWNFADNLNFVDESARVLYSPQQPEAYSHTKAIAEGLVLNANKSESAMITCAIRPSSIFGIGDNTIVMKMATAAKEGKYRMQIGNGENLFDFTYVENLVDAHLLAGRKALDEYLTPVEGPKTVSGEAFFITNDEPIRFWSFARRLGAAAGYPTDESKIKKLPAWFGLLIGFIAEWIVWAVSLGSKTPTLTRKSIRTSTIQRTFNIDKAKRVLGYRPRVGLDKAIELSGQWVKEIEETKRRAKDD